MPQKTNRNLTWAPAAQHDLRRLWFYLVDMASEDIANSISLDITSATMRLSERPYVGRPRDDVVAGLRSMLVHPYAIYYRVHDDSIEIIRVLHQRRDIRRALRGK